MVTERRPGFLLKLSSVTAEERPRSRGQRRFVSLANARFANSAMTQHLQHGATAISVRAIVDGSRWAVQSSDNLSASGIRTVVDKAIAAAKALKHDRFTYELLAPDSPLVQDNPRARSCFDPRIVAITAEDRLRACNRSSKSLPRTD